MGVSLFYSAFRSNSLTDDERRKIGDVLERGRLDSVWARDAFAKFGTSPKDATGEDFHLDLQEPGADGRILWGATGLPLDSDKVATAALHNWCNLLTLLRIRIAADRWEVHVEGDTIHWDPIKRRYAPELKEAPAEFQGFERMAEAFENLLASASTSGFKRGPDRQKLYLFRERNEIVHLADILVHGHTLGWLDQRVRSTKMQAWLDETRPQRSPGYGVIVSTVRPAGTDPSLRHCIEPSEQTVGQMSTLLETWMAGQVLWFSDLVEEPDKFVAQLDWPMALEVSIDYFAWKGRLDLAQRVVDIACSAPLVSVSDVRAASDGQPFDSPFRSEVLKLAASTEHYGLDLPDSD